MSWLMLIRIALEVLEKKVNNDALGAATSLVRLAQATNKFYEEQEGRPIDPDLIRQHDLLD